MKLAIRQKLGAVLIALPAIAIAIKTVTSSPSSVETYDGGSTTIGSFHLTTSTVVTTIHLPLALLLCGLAGLLCLLWPSHNPPRQEP